MLLRDLPIWFCLFTGQTSVCASLQKKEGYSGWLWNLLLDILRSNTMCGITSREIQLRLKIEFPFSFIFKKMLMPSSRILMFLYLMDSLQIKASSGAMSCSLHNCLNQVFSSFWSYNISFTASYSDCEKMPVNSCKVASNTLLVSLNTV